MQFSHDNSKIICFRTTVCKIYHLKGKERGGESGKEGKEKEDEERKIKGDKRKEVKYNEAKCN